MTTPSPTPLPVADLLEPYRAFPLDDGDALLLLPGDAVCLELGPVPDGGTLPGTAAATARGAHGGTAVLAVARRGRRARTDDLLLWVALGAALHGSDTELLPLQVLPAAA